MSVHVVIAAGGTGGHVFPALAVARELQARGATVSWLGTQRGLEADVVPAAGIEIDWVSVFGLRGNGIVGWLKAPWRLFKSVQQAKQALRKRHASVVLGMGGFVAGPAGIAAKLAGVPLVIHEQNSVPGMTNRYLAKVANRVLVAFPSVFANMPKRQYVGNPIRREIVDVLSPQQRRRPDEVKRLLVVGGSLGAAALNEIVPLALARIDAHERPEVWHQTGKKNLDEAKRAYASARVEANVVPFIDSMADAYAWADLVICRAGALTVAELAAVGSASILVPYPSAVDDHQTSNGRFLVDAGAAIMVQQKVLTPEILSEYLQDLFAQPEKLQNMAIKARELALPRASEVVANICLEQAHV
ncbi:MAG: undecaprenyldiphospho-muramoylpentapeptide beta-N-acetylglucosaminyltransferase [Gammaproteobacteria bacterium]|nr:undecaprenyldiphospho-muramoylpentapeptide beta-N-acetylglucosaminyltransferase [Gammaproteobacteria bacterium]